MGWVISLDSTKARSRPFLMRASVHAMPQDAPSLFHRLSYPRASHLIAQMEGMRLIKTESVETLHPAKDMRDEQRNFSTI